MRSWKPIALLYNLLLMAIGVALVVEATGYYELLELLKQAFSTPENRIITGSVGLIVIIITFIVLIKSFSRRPTKNQTFSVRTEGNSIIMITEEAVRNMITSVSLEIPGIREVNPQVTPKGSGIKVNLDIKADTEMSLPQLGTITQQKIRTHLEEVAGLKVNEITVQVQNLRTIPGGVHPPATSSTNAKAEIKPATSSTATETKTATPPAATETKP